MSRHLARIAVKTQAEAYNIEAEALWIGPDLLIYIWGGEIPHIGAVAMAQPRPSLADPQVISSTASVFAYVGHKEDLLAKQTAEALSAALNVKVVVTAGIHWDDLAPSAIEAVVTNSKQLIQLLIDQLKE